MTLVAWLAIGAYTVCYVAGFRIVFRGFAENDDDWTLVCLSLVLAVLIALVGPLVIAFQVLRVTVGKRDPQTFVRALAGESRADKMARLEDERRERERYIARLERELELTP